MAAITLTDVAKTHRGGVAAVRNVSLEIPDGAFCVIAGPSGSGKSTLLRLIAARDRVTDGTIAIGDAVHRPSGAAPLAVAEVADPAELKKRWNLYDNMAAGLHRRGVSKADVEARVLNAADALGLGPVLADKPRDVSADERWRTVLGRALAHRPPALLFDEPLGGVEPARRAALRLAFKRIQRASGATVVYATHDVADALALADLLVVIEGGVVLQSGPPLALYAAPASVAAARLSGPFGMNLLPVRANQTGLSLEDGTTLGAASVMTTSPLAILGVRPEHLFALGASGPPPHGLSLPLAVEAVEPGGADTTLHGRVGAHAVTARLSGSIAAVAGTVVRLGARREHLVLFDAVTHEAVPKPAAPLEAAEPVMPETAPAIPPHLQRDPRGDDAERAQHERRLAAARARLSR